MIAYYMVICANLQLLLQIIHNWLLISGICLKFTHLFIDNNRENNILVD